MKSTRFFLVGILAIILTLPLLLPTPVTAASATLQVRATIKPWLKFSASQHQPSYHVTTADVHKGYIDLPNSLSVDLQTNILDAITLQVANAGFGQVSVSEAGTGLDGSATSTVQVQSTHPAVTVSKQLDLRMYLPEGTIEGTYPLMVSLTPVAY